MTARTTILLMLCAAATAAGCGAASTEGPSAPPEARPPALFTVGRSLVGLDRGRVQLAAAPVAPLAGWLTPAAVPSADGRYVAYNAWAVLRKDDPALSWQDQGIAAGDALATPSLRLYDSATGSDEVLEEGAFSLAWRGDGALAYFKGAERDYRAGIPYVGQILVRSALAAAPETWTAKEARYIVAGWAGRTLIAYEEREGEALDVLALDGPGRVRVLARDSALVAIAPAGNQALLERGPANGRPTLRVVDVDDGSQAAALDLTTVDPAVGLIGYAGDWEDGLAVAPSASGLAVFRVGNGRIELGAVLRVAAEGGVAEPRFAGSARVTGWTTTDAGGAFLDCDRPCRRRAESTASRSGADLSTTQAARWKENSEMARIALLAALLLCWAATPAAAANGWWTFDRDTNVDSKLSWKWTYPPSPAQYTRSWRAGSGTTTDECQVGRGWLPAGWYAQNGHWDRYDGSKIKGRVWWMQDKYCRDGVTRRTELFIHSEETAANGQSCTSTYDDPFCWEREADYYSLGCIKLARPSPVASFPNDLGGAHATHHDYGGTDVHGQARPADTNELYVFS